MSFNNGRVHEVEDAHCVAETEDAILVLRLGEKEWVPKSQVHELSDVKQPGDEGILTVTWWFARKVGWVEVET